MKSLILLSHFLFNTFKIYLTNKTLTFIVSIKFFVFLNNIYILILTKIYSTINIFYKSNYTNKKFIIN